MTVVHVSCDGTLEIRPKQVPPPVIGDSRVAEVGQAALAQKLDVASMAQLDLRAKKLYAMKGYLYFALVVVIIALIFALMFSKFFIAAGIGGGILLLLLALKVNKWQISKVECQIQLLVKAHPQNPNVLALHWGSLHSRLMRERKQEDARELAEEFFKNGDRSHENIRLFVLDLKEKGFFENEESDPMEAVFRATGLRPFLIHQILDGTDLFKAKVLKELDAVIAANAPEGTNMSEEEILGIVREFYRNRVSKNCNLDMATVQQLKRIIHWVGYKKELISELRKQGVFSRDFCNWVDLMKKLGLNREDISEIDGIKDAGYFPLFDALERADLFEGRKAAITFGVLRDRFGIDRPFDYLQSLPRYRAEQS